MSLSRIAILSEKSPDAEKTALAILRAGMEPVQWEGGSSLADYSGYVVFDELGREIIDLLEKQHALAKPILGIGEGVEILLKQGWVPGLENNKVGITTAIHPVAQAHIRLSAEYQYNAFTRRFLPAAMLSVAPAKKQFVIAPALLRELEINGLPVFYYCNEKGDLFDIVAAVSNKMGNAMAMLSCPAESAEWDAIFLSMRDYIREGYKQPLLPLHYYPRSEIIKKG
jgi:phosphoribosylformylglycinamidine (FGAM) synthase-like amidotransferase family enzyme